ncbi:MAG: tRNA (guanosine(37)-N1)-methyltransferase TrmD [Firmicutes bacterium]|nr:tRNA (guanosine(37)-N1)-methyltransferase TrmD [Bacillota bacterium]
MSDMLNFHVMSLFCEMIKNALSYSIINRALKNKIININLIDIRDFSNDKNKRVDDYIYGGGCGMLIKAQPVYDAYKSIKNKVKKDCPVIYLSPQGKIFDQEFAHKLKNESDIILLCGHYEGIDRRVINKIVTHEISIGDYILTGGEIPAIVLIDCIARLVPGVLGNIDSNKDESFENNLLECDHYTRPEIFMDKKVPDVLLSGNHKKIKLWREKQAFIKTFVVRPDLLLKSKKKFMEENKMDMIFSRRSIRKYKNQEISDEQLELLLRAGMAAPSAMNSQNWEFIIIKNREHLIELSKLNPYHQMLKDAALAIVVCGDLNKILGEEYWIQNCSAATQNILTMANNLGLGAVWLSVAPYEDKMQRLINNLVLPENIKPLNIISLGVPDEFKSKNDNFDEKKVHYEKFSDDGKK